MSSQAVYCLSLQIQSNDDGKNSVTRDSTKNEPTTTAAASKKEIFESMQQQQQQQSQHSQQQLLLQQPLQQAGLQQLTNNIILLRGSRNENGQIVIQNKHDIITFINEQQQQQQQQQHDKSTAATLATQLPTATTIARKLQSGVSVVAAAAGSGSSNSSSNMVKESSASAASSNTILLQTPINASQLESVLLQSSNMKKSAKASLKERPFLVKNSSSRSLGSDSDRLSNIDNKGPFVLQTLKRLEKSQSILVIRNTSSSSSSSSSAAAATSTSVSNFKGSNNDLTTNSAMSSTATVSTNTGGAPRATNNSNNSNHLPTSLSFTRTSKGQQTKLANVIGQRITATALTSSSSSTSSAALTTSLSSLKAACNDTTTATTTAAGFLRPSNNTTAATVFANKTKYHSNNIGKANNSNAVVVVAGAGAAGSSNNGNNNHRSSRNILSGATTASIAEQQQQMSLADVQLKHKKTAATAATSSSSSAVTAAAAAAVAGHQQQQQTNAPLGKNGEPIKLPDNLESLPRADSFPSQRHRWNTNEEIAAILISFEKHGEWQSKEVRTRPKSGSLLLYSRKKVRYRRDGYCWKKRKDGKTTREDHMKLKVQGTECIYGCYVHSAILPTFHRRCYWLLQNPDIVLVHYLNVPYPDDNKMAVIAPSITLWGDKKEWTKEELVSQLKPMLSSVTSDDESDSGNDIEISTAETVDSLVGQLIEKQRLSRQAALVKQLDCGCGDSSCIDGKACSHPVMRRTGMLKAVSEKRATLIGGYNQTTTTAPNVVIGPKLYTRWPDRRTRDVKMDTGRHYPQLQQQQQQQQQQQHQQLPQEPAINFQRIQSLHNEQSTYQQQQQQHYRQHNHSNGNNNNNHVATPPHHHLLVNRNNLITQHQQPNSANFNQTTSATMTHSNQNNQINLQRFVANHNNNTNNNNSQIMNNNRLHTAKTTIIATTTAAVKGNVDGGGGGGGVAAELIGNQNHISANSNNSTHNNSNNNNRNLTELSLLPQEQQQQHQLSNDANVINNNSNNKNYVYNNTSISSRHSIVQPEEIYKMQQQQQQQQQHEHGLNSSVQPMCMSPEHQPLTPLQYSVNNNNNNNGNNDSLPVLLLNSSNNNMQTSSSCSSSSSPVTVASSSCHSSSPHIKDDGVVVVVNHIQSSSPSAASPGSSSALTTIKAENSISSSNETNNVQKSSIDLAATEVSAPDTNSSSSNSNMQQNHRLPNNVSSSNNKHITEYKNSDHNANGCQPLSASHENSNSTNDEIATIFKKDFDARSHPAFSFESMETNLDAGAVGSNAAVAVDLREALGFFNETLDLSQEDIQRTLIANLPFGTEAAHDLKRDNSSDETSDGFGSPLLNSVSFLATNCASDGDDGVVAVPLSGGGCGAGGAHDDETNDVFVNLDAFDMLVEFPELDLDDKQALSHASLDHDPVHLHGTISHSNGDDQHSSIISTADAQQPLYSYEVVGSGKNAQQCDRKLLNICDFSPEWSYTEGGVKVLVAGPWTNANAAYSVLFDSLPVPTMHVQEGVLRCFCPAHDVGFATLQVSCDGYVISNSAMFEYKLSLCPETSFDMAANECLYKFTLMNRLTSIDEKLQIKTELTEQQALYSQANFEEKLVSYCNQLMKAAWRPNLSGSSCLTSSFKGMSLLHLASALGYAKLVCTMLNWRTENPNVILETEIDALSQDVYGYTPMMWACARGHTETALLLYKWNQNALKIRSYAQQTPLDVATANGHKLLIQEIYRLEYRLGKKCNKSSLSSLSLSLNKNNANDKNAVKIEQNATENGRATYNEKLVDNLDISGQEATTFDLPRSHDGVFLRPVAVASNQSPPNYNRFAKRSSVDSGINMDIRGKAGKSLKDIARLQSFDVHDQFSSTAMASPLDSFNTTNSATASMLSPLRKMDFALCEVSTGDTSPLTDREHDDDSSTLNNDDDISDVVLNSEQDGVVGDSDAKVLTLAEHIIAAMPERIKNEADEMMILGSPMTEALNSESSGLTDSFMDPLLDSLPNAHFDSDFSLDFNDHSYRYHDVSTPCSSLSPASSGPLQSPASYSLLGTDPSVNSPSPPPSTKQLTEFLHASSNSQCPFETDFSRLTLTDSEQRELYEAAKCIQKAYRSYKGRQKLEEQNKERSAAIVIQNYYRRYKQYAYYRQMTSAALVIQHGYRSYCRNKRFKKSQQSSSSSIQHSSSSTSQCLSSFYDHYKNDQQQQDMFSSQSMTPKETSPSGPLKRTYSQSTQNQAARKIQQFMRQSRIKLQKERAEKEKLVHQRRAEYLQSLQFQGLQGTVCKAEQSEGSQANLYKMQQQPTHSPSNF